MVAFAQQEWSPPLGSFLCTHKTGWLCHSVWFCTCHTFSAQLCSGRPVCVPRTRSRSNNDWEITLQSASESTLKFTLASAILSAMGRAFTTWLQWKCKQVSVVITTFQFNHSMYSSPAKNPHLGKHSWNYLSPGNNHTFCQTQEVPWSEKSHKNYTSLFASPTLILVDIKDFPFACR